MERASEGKPLGNAAPLPPPPSSKSLQNEPARPFYRTSRRAIHVISAQRGRPMLRPSPNPQPCGPLLSSKHTSGCTGLHTPLHPLPPPISSSWNHGAGPYGLRPFPDQTWGQSAPRGLLNGKGPSPKWISQLARSQPPLTSPPPDTHACAHMHTHAHTFTLSGTFISKGCLLRTPFRDPHGAQKLKCLSYLKQRSLIKRSHLFASPAHIFKVAPLPKSSGTKTKPNS